MDTGGFGGFRDEDDDLGDLLPRASLAASSSMSFGFEPSSTEGDDLSTNPFADMESSHVYSRPEPSYSTHDDDDAARAHDQGGFASSSSPPSASSHFFSRESAPEPESPDFSRQTSPSPYNSNQYSPVVAASPYSTATAYSPPPASAQTPFGSPPASPTSPTAFRKPVHRSPADMLDLLGEEKPILPSFSKRREGSAFGREELVLPVSSLGKKKAAGALATLLGLEDDAGPSEKAKEKPKVDRSAAAVKATPAAPALQPVPPPPPAKVEPLPVPEHAPAPPDPSLAPPASPSLPSVASATSIPLPPSPTASPPPSSAATASLSRTPSLAPSTNSEAERGYASLVSPMDTGAPTSEAGAEPEHGLDGVAVLSSKLEALKVASGETSEPTDTPAKTAEDDVDPSSTPTATAFPASTTLPAEPASSSRPASPFHSVFPTDEPTSPPPSNRPNLFEDDSSAPSPTHTRGFRSYNGSTYDDERNGGFDDVDSLRGTYTRSLDVTEDDTGMDTETGADSFTTETENGSSNTRGGFTSPPLPAVPLPLPKQTSPRSSSESGALGQSFIISVGDPQKIGSSLNVAAQHTVYTVRTQTTSSAFRKPEFSVLRRFSHFLWLFDALTLNNPGVIVPGMPEKSALGRFGSEFVENRRSALQAALMKIVSHPMLVGDPDLRLFLESDSFSVDIKQRRIETPAENTGFLASLTSTISGPKFSEFDEYFETRRQTLDTFEVQLKSLLVSLANAAKHRAALQASLGELESALLGLSMCDLSGPLRGALEKSAGVQKRLRELSERQSESEEQIGGLTSVAEGYARLCGSVKLVFGARVKSYHAWQAAESNLRKAKTAHDKAKKSGRAHSELLGLSLSETADAERKMLDAKQDFEDVSKLTKAEMARFDKEKVDDFKKAVADYADALVLRQREVVALWTSYHEVLQSAVAASTPAPPPLQITEGTDEPQS